MKITLEIADDLFEQAQRLAHKEKITFSALAERGIRLRLKKKLPAPRAKTTSSIKQKFSIR